MIRGTAVNHGGRTNGYTVPNPRAQAELIARGARARAASTRATRRLRRGARHRHRAGRPDRDRRRCAEAFGERTDGRGCCAIGSVKSQHRPPARRPPASPALTKVLLQLRHRHDRAVAALRTRSTRDIDFAAAPFAVPQQASRGRRRTGPAGAARCAGVSAFGAGGANAHVVIEEYLAPPVPPAEPGPEILVLSAANEERLRAYAGRIAAFLRTIEPGLYRDVARTLQVGRRVLPVRLGLVASTAAEAADALDRYLAGDQEAVFVATAAEDADQAELVQRRYLAGDLVEAARLWTTGGKPDWKQINGGPVRRVPVPGYPLQRAAGTVVEEPTDASSIDAITQAFEAGNPQLDVELEAAYPLLGRYAAGRAARRLRDMGLPAAGGTAADVRECLGVRPQFHRFLDACLAVLERHGHLRRAGQTLQPVEVNEDLAELRGTILHRHPEAYPFIRLLDTCVEAYPHILRGEIPATDVLFPGSGVDLMAGVYQGSPAYDFYSQQLARFVANLVEVQAKAGRQPVRILEVGAGTGSTSRAVLEAVAASDAEVEYHYTDVGGSFVAHGRRTFAKQYPFVRFGVLDAERDPVEQGFPSGDFDSVVAASALHAVADIHSAGYAAPAAHPHRRSRAGRAGRRHRCADPVDRGARRLAPLRRPASPAAQLAAALGRAVAGGD